jgi:hypothetical protein
VPIRAVSRLALLLIPLAALPGRAVGQDAGKWYDRISFGGDFRIRSESFFQDRQPDRTRGRLRVRAGFTAPLSDRFTVGVRLATGNPGNITSANVTMGEVFAQRPFTLDRLYLTWKASDRVTITGGKFGLPLWRPEGLLRSELPFDEEVPPEGLHEEVVVHAARAGLVRRLTVLADQWTVRESGSGQDVWMLGGQAVLELAPGPTSRLGLGLGYLDFVNGRSLAQARNSNAELVVTNRVVTRNGVLVRGGVPSSPSAADPFDTFVSDFRLIRSSAGLTGKLGGRDAALYGEWVHNTGAAVDNNGFWVGVTLGNPRRAGEWGVGVAWARVEQEAALSMMSYSDLGVGGTNVTGPIVQVSWRPTREIVLQAKNHFVTLVDDTVPGANPNLLQRLQLDARVSF